MSEQRSKDAEVFLGEARKLADKFGWPAKNMQHGDEVGLVAITSSDPSFQRFLWIFDLDRLALRCMLISNTEVAKKKQPAIFELCCRINQGLPWGCAEFSFSEQVVVFRDSGDLQSRSFSSVVPATTARVLQLGKRYAPAISETMRGIAPEDAVAKAEM